MKKDQNLNSGFSSIIEKFLDESYQSTDCFPHAISRIEIRETHISWIILTGEFAYKIKKPVDLGFLDFSTLSKRKFYCEEEIRLNQRWAPKVYLDVVAITGSLEYPKFCGDGKILEYAVRMKQFPPNQTLDLISEENHLESKMIDSIAKNLASLHKSSPVVELRSELGSAEYILSSTIDNFKSILTQNKDTSLLKQLSIWTKKEFENNKSYFMARKSKGFVRECHGDLHLGNMAWVDEEILFFDGIEFNERFRFIDVISEVAFVVMDLMEKKKENLAWRLLNLYLEETGDYEGLACLSFYLTYRAMVRAKVACLRSNQTHLSEYEQKNEQDLFQDYLNLAQSFTVKENGRIILTCGYSGSGKTSLARKLYRNSIIHIRSDVERKRLFADQHEIEPNIYTESASDKTYARLLAFTEILVKEGFTVIVDATFLETKRREPFQLLAHELNCDYHIIHCIAKEETLRKRIEERKLQNNDVSDATLDILSKQIAKAYRFTEFELNHLHAIDTEENYLVSKLDFLN
jgi:uncharacterized protein